MKYLKNLSLILIAILFLASCVDQKFDEPPYSENGEDPVITGTIKTMDEVKALLNGVEAKEIKEDWYLQGIVISDDEPGNFYKEIYIQDEKGPGGIKIGVDASELHATYPLFRRVFVKLQGLWIGQANNVYSIGSEGSGNNLVNRIPQSLVEEHLLGGVFNVDLAPTVLRIDELDNKLHAGTLVKIEGMQFSDGDLGKTFAEEKVNTNFDIADCEGNTLTLRNSGYSDFYPDEVPSGNGSITAVYNVYRDFQQLYINRPSDLDFSGDRCGSGTGVELLVSLASLRQKFDAGATSVEEETKIVGVVVSDKENGNGPHKQNIVFQDETGGIEVRFSGEHSFKVDDELEIVVSLAALKEYRGTLQINNVSLSAAKLIGNKKVVPRVATFSEILSNKWNWQSTLVKIVDVEIEGGKFSDGNGNRNITDATGEMTLFTWSDASFANQQAPSGKVDLIGIIAKYKKDDADKDQIKMRTINDVTDGDGTGGGGECSDLTETFSESFDGGFGAWTIVSVSGSQEWLLDEENHGNPGNCAKMSGWNGGGADANEDWMITPSVDLSGATAACLTFETAKNYNGNDLELYVSTDYSGSGDPSVASWTSIDFTKSSGDWSWTPSGAIDLTSYVGGDMYVGFKFTCTTDGSATWEIDNVVIKK